MHDVRVSINDDNLNELNESFSLTASSLTYRVTIVPGRDVAIITIVDNDCKKIQQGGAE